MSQLPEGVVRAVEFTATRRRTGESGPVRGAVLDNGGMWVFCPHDANMLMCGDPDEDPGAVPAPGTIPLWDRGPAAAVPDVRWCVSCDDTYVLDPVEFAAALTGSGHDVAV